MKKHVLALFVAVVTIVLTVPATAQVIVIANPSVKATAVSVDELRDIFTGMASSLKDGSRVTPVTLRGGATHEIFLKAYTGKNETAFRATWRGLVFSGQAMMPKVFESEEEMVAYVARTPGALGYVSKGVPTSGVRILSVR
jgi:ABC-type phosphate transport system substrate-binding protein